MTEKSASIVKRVYYLENQPAVVSFGSADMDEDMPDLLTANSNALSGFIVDPDSQALLDRANKFAKAYGIPFLEAISRIEAQ